MKKENNKGKEFMNDREEEGTACKIEERRGLGVGG